MAEELLKMCWKHSIEFSKDECDICALQKAALRAPAAPVSEAVQIGLNLAARWIRGSVFPTSAILDG